MALRLPRLFRLRRDALRIAYGPRRNGRPDPGEVCWAWVPFEEDPTRGKDRPIVVIAVAGDRVVALGLTSKDHDQDAEREAQAGRFWMDVGTGDWDRQRRPSEVRLDRPLVLDVAAVRREGGAMPRAIFDEIVRAATPYLPERRDG